MPTPIPTPLRCPSCQEPNRPNSLLCKRCGVRLRPIPGTRVRAALNPELVRHLAGRSGDFYAAVFRRMFPADVVSLRPSWNWAAALVPFWMCFRGLYLEMLAAIVCQLAVALVCPPLGLAVTVAQGMYGNALYFRALERRARRAPVLA